MIFKRVSLYTKKPNKSLTSYYIQVADTNLSIGSSWVHCPNLANDDIIPEHRHLPIHIRQDSGRKIYVIRTSGRVLREEELLKLISINLYDLHCAFIFQKRELIINLIMTLSNRY